MAAHLGLTELGQGLELIRRSPRDVGTLELLVRRPAEGEREELEEGELDLVTGLVGDSWSTRPNRRTPDGGPNPEQQLNIMNVHAALLVAGGDPSRRALCGDQLYVDLDIGEESCPAGTRLAIGDAVVEITAAPHLGCAKFAERFGKDAVRFVNSAEGRALKLRGACAKVVVPGRIRRGDAVRKV